MTESVRKEADLLGSDAYPGETLEKQEAADLPPLPEPIPDLRPQRYRWVFVNGELHLSPVHDHAQLLKAGRADLDAEAPVALGEVDVRSGHAVWSPVASNVGGRGLYEILAHYSREVGWRFGGLRLAGLDDVATRRAFELPAQTYWYRETGDNVEIAAAPIKGGIPIDVMAGVARVAKTHPGLEEWAADNNFKIAEVPGGGNMLDHMRHREDIEMYNRQDPEWKPEEVNTDTEPSGPFTCPHCDFQPQTFSEYKLHQRDHEMGDWEPIQDGHFPQPDDYDEPLPLRRNQPYPEMAWNGVQAKVMVLPDAKLAHRIPEFELYSKLFGFEQPGCQIFGAFQDGGLVGYAVVRVPPRGLAEWTLAADRTKPAYVPSDLGGEPELMMVQSGIPGRGIGTVLLETVKRHFGSFYSHADSPAGEALMRRCGMVNVARHRWRYAAGGEPKDMIEADVPFIYDIQNDKLEIGYPGTTPHDIQGQFMPGGIVEGYYQPGGTVVIQTSTSIPYSVRHLIDLWYWTAPQMRVTGVEQMERDGSTNKLAADGPHIGSYIRTLVASDVAAANAYKALRNAGGRVFVVGGAVRDALRGSVPNDVDMMVGNLPPSEVEHALRQLPGSVNETGKRFGVFRYKVGGHEVEIALPRTDQYESGRRGEGKITVDPDLPVEKDLERRDFTANSMAVDLDTGALIDPFGGSRDIGRGVLRTTHPDSFREDPTRLVRALAAHGNYGLLPDERTRHEMESQAHLLRGESPDALNKTLDKLFKSENPAQAIRLGQETGLLQHLFPEVAENWGFDQRNPHHNYALGEHLLHVLDNTARLTKDPDVRMAALLHDVGKPASAWTDANGISHYYHDPETGQGQHHEAVGAQMAMDRMRSLNYPVARINRVGSLIQHHMFPPFVTPKGARRFLQKTEPHADDLLNLREADQTGKGQMPEEVAARTQAEQMRKLVENARAQDAPTNLSTLNVNGTDLVNMGLRPGPAIGQILNQLMDHVIENPMDNERGVLMGLAQNLVNQQQPEAFA